MPWRRFQTIFNYAALVLMVVLQLSVFRDTPTKPFVWFFLPLMLPQVVLEFFLARRRRRAWREHPLNRHRETPATFEAALVLIRDAETSLKVHSDKLNPALREPLEAAQARGLTVELFLDEPGIAALRDAGSTLSPELWVPEPEHRMRQLMVDATYVVRGSFIGDGDVPFGPEDEKVRTMVQYLLDEVMPKRRFLGWLRR